MVFEKIRSVVVDQLGVSEEEVTLETSFEELGVDSLDLFQIIIDLEEEFNIRIEDADNIKSIEDAVNYIEQRI